LRIGSRGQGLEFLPRDRGDAVVEVLKEHSLMATTQCLLTIGAHTYLSGEVFSRTEQV